ncbi:hypothetical protein CGLO_05732 [Colletotrichum gloeosporioides Cg-14]|uniref:Uncharacterized protein n=1 Tax=Colletotrichum gloeosporioides (strain Cg-14) TaxID=1237896 RepID=T0KGB6_COLGC|nr:hypothetical protein CGLO_05732 [Colletotrichum gloeosporioides Cg-14]
MPKERDIG